LRIGISKADPDKPPIRAVLNVPFIAGRQDIYDFQKYFLTDDPNQRYLHCVPSRYEGRFAIVTSAGRDAVAAAALSDEQRG
jgi:hypothetical protein